MPIQPSKLRSIGLHSTLNRADWYALRLLNHLRLLLLIAFAAAFYIGDGFGVLGIRDLNIFKYCHMFWLVLALGFNSSIKLRAPSLETQFYLQSYIDILMVCILMYASGGTSSGIGIALVAHIAIIANFAKIRYTILFAAIASIMVLSQELASSILHGSDAASLAKTSIIGIMLFGVAVFSSLMVQRYSLSPLESTPRSLSVRQLAELNEEIIREIDSGVLHIDTEERVQLINETAALMLSTEGLLLPAHLGLISDPLYKSYRKWHKNTALATPPLSHSSLPMEILPNFIALKNGGTLIRLDNQSAIKTQLQQLKLASLGRLSTSIAHEIRNPLGAISNSVQLLEESPHLNSEERRLIDIANHHTGRINRIIEDVMQMASRKETFPEMCFIADVLHDFRERFLAQNQLPESTVLINLKDKVITEFDLHHLDQILWNLCSNALVHSCRPQPAITIASYQVVPGKTIIEVTDNGDGIPDAEKHTVFEPFFTTKPRGTGLGLYIIRELCELNNATIDYVPQRNGTCFRIAIAPPTELGPSREIAA